MRPRPQVSPVPHRPWFFALLCLVWLSCGAMAGAQNSVTVPDAGFETPVVGAGNWQYDPTGSPWTFNGPFVGISGNGSGYSGGNPPAPEGVQVAMLKRTGTISQSLPGFQAGVSYTLTVAAAQRSYSNASGPNSQTFQVQIDGQAVGGNVTPTGTSYSNYTIGPFIVSAGSHTLSFVGLDPNGDDNTAFLDNVRITGQSVAPAVPSGLTATPGNTQVGLAWAAVSGATGYNVYRGAASGGPYTKIVTVPTASDTDSGLTNGTAYYYVVTALSSGGESGYSNQSSATPNAASVLSPTGLVATTSSGQTYISLSWTSVTGASSYNLYRATTSGGEGSIPYKSNVNNGTYTSYTDSGLTAGTTYYYQVTAVSGGTESGKSPEASATVGTAPLPAPVLKGVAGSTSDVLTWSAVTGATSYNLYRNGSLYQLGLTTASYTDSGLTAGTQYSYYVCGVNASGQGSSSNSVSLTPGSAALAAPRLTASTNSGSTYVSLSWTSVTGATSYDLYRGTTAGGEGSIPYKVNVSNGTGTSYSDSGLTAGTTYYYEVVAVGPGGEGATSNEASATVGSTPLAAPLLKGVAGATSNALTWSAVSGATSYNLYRSVSGSYYGTLYQLGLTTTSFTDASLTAGTQYSYYVCAVNTGGQGSQSNSVSLTPGSTALTAPVLSASTYSGQTYISLSWTAVTGATSYDLYRGTAAGGEGSIPYKLNVSNGTGTSYSDSGLAAGTTYYYEVVPVGPGGESTPSNEASATVGAAPLAAPVLKGVAGATSNALTWSSVSGATSYNLYRSTGGYGYGGTLYQRALTSTTYTDSGLTAGTQYSYYVCAVNTSGQGSSSNSVSLTPGSTALAAPVLSATAYSTSISLSWTSVTGATSYDLYRGTTSGGEGSIPYKVNVSSGTGTSYSDSGLTSGTTYYYKVVAVGPGGEGTFSNEASATVGAATLPAPLLKGVAGATSDVLTWSAVTGATSYNLYRYTGTYGYGTLYQQGLTGTTFTDSGLTAGTQYGYYVCAVNTGGQGSSSNTVSLTPGAAALAGPLLTASTSTYTNGGLGSVSLSWTAVTGATSYDLYRGTTAGGEGSIPYKVNVSSGSSTSYTDSSLTPGTTYYYKVVAVGTAGEGAPSNEASATVGTQPLAGLTNLTATPAPQGGQSIALSWGTVTGATSYNIYRGSGTGGYPGYGSLYLVGVTGTSYTDTNVSFGPTYSYYVCAVNTSGQGTNSNTASAALYGFGVVPSTSSVTVTRGTVGAVAVTVVPGGGYTAPIALSGSGLPAGVAAWFYPPNVTLSTITLPEYLAPNPSECLGGTVTTDLDIAVPLTATPGTYMLQIAGNSTKGDGYANTQTVTLIIN